MAVVPELLGKDGLKGNVGRVRVYKEFFVKIRERQYWRFVQIFLRAFKGELAAVVPIEVNFLLG